MGLRVSAPSRAATQQPSNFQRCPAQRPRRRLSASIVGPRARAQSAGLRRPMALAARARAPRLRCRRLSSAAPPLFSCCHSALSPALSSAPCPAALAAGPEPPRAGSAATFPAPLVLGSLPLSGLCLSNGLSCLPRSRCLPLLWSLSSPRSPSQSLLCLPQPLPYLFPARLRLPPGLSSVSLAFALSVRPPLSRTQAPAAAASPARPGARAPDARGAPRTPNSPHAAPLCETFAPPHT